MYAKVVNEKVWKSSWVWEFRVDVWEIVWGERGILKWCKTLRKHDALSCVLIREWAYTTIFYFFYFSFHTQQFTRSNNPTTKGRKFCTILSIQKFISPPLGAHSTFFLPSHLSVWDICSVNVLNGEGVIDKTAWARQHKNTQVRVVAQNIWIEQWYPTHKMQFSPQQV